MIFFKKAIYCSSSYDIEISCLFLGTFKHRLTSNYRMFYLLFFLFIAFGGKRNFALIRVDEILQNLDAQNHTLNNNLSHFNKILSSMRPRVSLWMHFSLSQKKEGRKTVLCFK